MDANVAFVAAALDDISAITVVENPVEAPGTYGAVTGQNADDNVIPAANAAERSSRTM